MKRTIFIIIWCIASLLFASIVGGLLNGILLGFTDFDVENNVGMMVLFADIILAVFFISFLVLSLYGKLPGTKKAKVAQNEG